MRLIDRPRPQRFLRWLGKELQPHIPPRHSINFVDSNLQGVAGQIAPLVQINEPDHRA
jgi:hypothetical protein